MLATVPGVVVSQQPIPAVHWIHWLLLWDDCFHSGGVGPCGTHFLDQGDEGKGCPCSTVLSGAGTTRSSLRYACCYPGAARVYSPSPAGGAAPTRQGRDTTGNMAVRCGKSLEKLPCKTVRTILHSTEKSFESCEPSGHPLVRILQRICSEQLLIFQFFDHCHSFDMMCYC